MMLWSLQRHIVEVLKVGLVILFPLMLICWVLVGKKATESLLGERVVQDEGMQSNNNQKKKKRHFCSLKLSGSILQIYA